MLRCGDLRDYSDAIVLSTNKITDRGLDDPSRGLLPPPEGEFRTLWQATTYEQELVARWKKPGTKFIIVGKYCNATDDIVDGLSVIGKVHSLQHQMEAFSTREWERFQGGRYFWMSKAVVNRLRHGNRKRGAHIWIINMDSVGWVDAEILISTINAAENHDMNMDWDDLVLLATTGPKARIQLGFVYDRWDDPPMVHG